MAVVAGVSIFPPGTERVYTVIKTDERRDVESRSAEDMVRPVRVGS